MSANAWASVSRDTASSPVLRQRIGVAHLYS